MIFSYKDVRKWKIKIFQIAKTYSFILQSIELYFVKVSKDGIPSKGIAFLNIDRAVVSVPLGVVCTQS